MVQIFGRNFSDCCKGYTMKDLKNAGYDHLTVNYRYNFADPNTGWQWRALHKTNNFFSILQDITKSRANYLI